MSSLEAGHEAALQRIADMPPISVEGDRIVSEEGPGTSTPATPAGNEPAAATPADQPEDSFTKLDPNTLPPELRPFYTSMQADYTRKMQDAAPYRSLASELGLEASDLRQAAELYTALQDPNQLVQFHSELSDALVQAGLSPAQAAQAATEHIENVQAGGQPDTQWSDDPEERRIQELEARLASFEASQQQQAEQLRREQMQMALVSEMNRQESVIKEAHPDWTQDEIDAVYELSAFYGGSLIDAAARFDDVLSSSVARILNGKGAVATNPAHAPLPPAVAGLVEPKGFGDNLEAAHEAALKAASLLP